MVSKTTIFANSELRKNLFQRVSILKNRHMLAFGSIKCYLRIIWPYRFFQHEDMILRKPTNTYDRQWKSLKFFQATQSRRSDFLKLSFLNCLSRLTGSHWVSKLKKCLLLTFATIKSFWNVVWSYCLFEQTNMILNMFTDTAVMIWKSVENFFKGFESKLFIHKTSFFKLFERWDSVSVGIKIEKPPIAHVCDNKIFLKRYITIMLTCADWYDPKHVYRYCDNDLEDCRKVF